MYGRFVFIFLILAKLIKIDTRDDGFCALSLKSMEVVSSCPSNKEEMEKSSRKKNCSQYIDKDAGRDCRDYKKIKYHCVIISDLELIEVCAPERVIHGFCTEFIEEKGRIQGHNYLDCTDYAHPCPTSYKSSSSYLYQDCYNLTNNKKQIQDTQRGPQTPVTDRPTDTTKHLTDRATDTTNPFTECPTLPSKNSLSFLTQSSLPDWAVTIISSIIIILSITVLFLVLCICKLPRYTLEKCSLGVQNEVESDSESEISLEEVGDQ